MSIRDAFQKKELDWEITFAVCTDDLEGLEFRISMLPHVTMEEVNRIVLKFHRTFCPLTGEGGAILKYSALCHLSYMH